MVIRLNYLDLPDEQRRVSAKTNRQRLRAYALRRPAHEQVTLKEQINKLDCWERGALELICLDGDLAATAPDPAFLQQLKDA